VEVADCHFSELMSTLILCEEQAGYGSQSPLMRLTRLRLTGQTPV